MSASRELARLGRAVEGLYDFLDQDEGIPERDKLMKLVHEVNSCYINYVNLVDMPSLEVVD